MNATFSFGSLDAPRPEREAGKKRFRIAIMGDFSGRSARGEVEIGSDLASRRPIKFDIDTVEKVIAGFATTLILPIGKDGAGIEVELSNLDALHPDELFENVEMFAGLASLKRRLSSASTAKNTAAELRAWGEEFGHKITPPSRKSAGNSVPADRKLSDFAKLVGGKPKYQAEASAADDLIARAVGPYIQAIPDGDVSDMQDAVDEALGGAMRLLLHHPEFQSVEAQWRMLDLLARSIETDSNLDIVLYDISAEELAADLSAVEDLSQSGLCELLVESTPDGRGPFAAVCGLYTFEETPPHAELLGRIAKVAAHVDCAFFAAISPEFMDTPMDERHPLVASAWDALREQPESANLGLVTPRFLLRRPFGAKTEPTYEIEFEEFTPHEGMSGLLWANPVALVAILLARSFRKNGASLGLGTVMGLGEVPFIFVTDRHGDQVALPCTERNLTQAKATSVQVRGFMPVVSIKGRDEVRLTSFQSLAGTTIRGPWSTEPAPKPIATTKPASVAPAPAPAAAEVDDELNAMLAELDAGTAATEDTSPDDAIASDAVTEDTVEESGTGDADLDALLASFGDDAADASASENEGSAEDMDPELAALLASL